MISISQKMSFFLTLSLLAAHPCAYAMDLQKPDQEPVYWSTLPNPKKQVVYKFSEVVNHVSQHLQELLSPLYSARFNPEDLEKLQSKEDGAILAKVNELLIPLNTTLLDGAGFSPHTYNHISTIFSETHLKLQHLLNPFQEEYNLLRKKNNITESDITSFSEKLDLTMQKLPSADTQTLRQQFFPGYLGEKPPLNPQITKILNEFESEVQTRQKLDHSETVMEYGSQLAQRFFPQMVSVLPELININMEEAKSPSSISLQDWINDNVKDHAQKTALEKLMAEKSKIQGYTAIYRALDNSILAANSSIRSLNSDYVWRSTYHLVRTLYKQKADDKAKDLLCAYLLKLQEQDDACITGGIGRNFQIFAQAYKLLIERKSED